MATIERVGSTFVSDTEPFDCESFTFQGVRGFSVPAQMLIDQGHNVDSSLECVVWLHKGPAEEFDIEIPDTYYKMGSGFVSTSKRKAQFCMCLGLEDNLLTLVDDQFRVETRVYPPRNQEGAKHDDGKARWDLMPWDALEGCVKVLGFGAEKYNDRNWEKGIKYSRVFAALQRHLLAWYQGQETDPESGLPHLAHAQCCVLFLNAYAARNMGEFDDRP